VIHQLDELKELKLQALKKKKLLLAEWFERRMKYIY
jgi:hypothetical protein